MHTLWYDIGAAWRQAIRRPATSLLIVITLALGVGVNTAMFSVVWHALLAPLPYTDGDRLVKLEQRMPGNGSDALPWSLPTLADLRSQTTTLSAVLQYFQESYTLYSEHGAFQVDTGVVDGRYFSTLGVEPALGRLFSPTDDSVGAAPVLLLGNEFWRESLGADAGVLGSTMTMNGIAYTVLGVLPDLPPFPRTNAVWVPAASDFVMANPAVLRERRETLVPLVIGRLGDGVTLAQAQQDLAVITERLRREHPDLYSAASGYTLTLQPLQAAINGDASRTFAPLMALATLVVLVACCNVANLTLAATLRRRQQLAIWEAVGAGPGRIRRQLLTENLLVAGVGGLVGLLLAVLSLPLVTDFAALYTPLASSIRLDAYVLAFGMLLALLCGVLSGIVAGSQTSNIARTLKEGGDNVTASAGAQRLRHLLLGTECALAFVALTCSALMGSSLLALINQPTGYDSDHVAVLRVTMRGTTIDTMWPERDMILQVLEETRALPGVMTAGLSGLPLLEGPGFLPVPIRLDARSTDAQLRDIRAPFTIVSQGFFDVLQTPLLAGRHFADSDDDKAPEVVIVNASFARQYFPAGDAVGQRLSMNGGKTWATIVGIVGDIRARAIDNPDTAMVYTPYRASPTQRVNIYVNTRVDPQATTTAVTAILHRLDPLQPIEAVTTLTEVRARWLAPARLRTAIVVAFGVLALVVTLAGVVGVVSCNVGQRLREIGVHMAVGATPSRVRRLFLWQGMRTCVVGLLVGLVLMRVIAPLLTPLLYGIAALHAGLWSISACVLGLAVGLALLVPARKAGQIDPLTALRSP